MAAQLIVFEGGKRGRPKRPRQAVHQSEDFRRLALLREIRPQAFTQLMLLVDDLLARKAAWRDGLGS